MSNSKQLQPRKALKPSHSRSSRTVYGYVTVTKAAEAIQLNCSLKFFRDDETGAKTGSEQTDRMEAREEAGAGGKRGGGGGVVL